MPAQIEFNVPLTPVLIASLQEVRRLQQSPNPLDLEALELLLEVINPMLKKPCSDKGRSCYEHS